MSSDKVFSPLWFYLSYILKRTHKLSEIDFFEKYDEEQLTLFNAIANESERACVIVGAANIDALLGDLITKVLISVKAKDRICSDDSSFSTFSAKTALAYQMGLIDKHLFSQLNMLRKIRNDFSHQVTGCKLNEPPHMNRFSDLKKSVSNNKSYKRMPKTFPNAVVEEPEYVLEMKCIIVYLSSTLSMLTHFVEPIYINNSKVMERYRENT